MRQHFSFKIDPLSYGVDALRFALVGSSHFSFALDMGVPVVLAVIILGIGSLLFSRMEIK